MLVSVVIPARDWDEHLVATVASVQAPRPAPTIDLEILVGLAGAAPTEVPAGVRIIPNPSGTIPDALNGCIAAAVGEVIVRVDSRCVVGRDHIARAVQVLEDPTVGCVGGAQLVLDRGVFGTAYAVAFNSPLLGPSTYRYGRTSGPIDSAYLGAWRRRDLQELGGFDARLLRNQDNELSDRVRSAGFTVWFDAGQVVGYRNNRSFRQALAHHREFGLWRMVQAGHGQRSLTPRHVVAITGAASAGAGMVGALRSRRTRRAAIALAGGAYAGAAAGAFASARRLRRARPDIDGPGFHPLGVALAPAAAAVIDAAWAFGLVEGKVGRRRSTTH